MFVPHSEFDVAEGSQPLEETANAANAPIIDDPPLVRFTCTVNLVLNNMPTLRKHINYDDDSGISYVQPGGS
ncbi:hypothetical protein HanXRQr2_Chr11g0491491 [Helianthus annuus]|uniref:Uncharacterized protein n=1 Tax=Helianthus annuus TaxID=4232 RepID=A0A9K3HNZ0_HELAN|nr:hypothetical protein HanXRQr2_Chr11g0491491 [Helianthus annuus]KAJ0875219.1 hypothetical protein HanPSC8_Chr11g0473621 [Helianthus annuus]